MKFVSILIFSCIIVTSGCFSKKVVDPINSNPAAEEELEKNDNYRPWWAVQPSAANGVVIITNTTSYSVNVYTNSSGAKIIAIQ